MEYRRRSVPGGTSGLQIREGPRGGPWWVRLPLSSATFMRREYAKPACTENLIRIECSINTIDPFRTSHTQFAIVIPLEHVGENACVYRKPHPAMNFGFCQ